jgi:DNA-binding NarL/FixJ family response regulator
MICDDHPVVREGLKRILADHADLRIVAEAGSGEEAVEKCVSPQVQVLLLDISMPGPGFLETLRRIREARPSLPVLVLTIHPEKQYALRALRAGADGYMTKDQSPRELARAIRHVFEGEKFVTGALASQLVRALTRKGGEAPHEGLSDREFQVMNHLCAGLSTKEIAATLGLSPKTVSTYRSRLLMKLGLSSNAELIRYAIDHGLA